MTYKQTREQFLLAWNSNAYLNMCTSDDMRNVIEALDKQIPKKPLFIGGRNICPSCYNDGRSLNHYCDVCGQKIDWWSVE